MILLVPLLIPVLLILGGVCWAIWRVILRPIPWPAARWGVVIAAVVAISAISDLTSQRDHPAVVHQIDPHAKADRSIEFRDRSSSSDAALAGKLCGEQDTEWERGQVEQATGYDCASSYP